MIELLRNWVGIGEEAGNKLDNLKNQIDCVQMLVEMIEKKEDKNHYISLAMTSSLQIDMLIKEYESLSIETVAKLHSISKKCDTIKKYVDAYQKEINEKIDTTI